MNMLENSKEPFIHKPDVNHTIIPLYLIFKEPRFIFTNSYMPT